MKKTTFNRPPMTPTDHAHSPWLTSYPPGVPKDAAIADVPAHRLLDDTVKAFPDRPAFDFMGKKWTWAQIGDLTDRFAAGLQKAGIGKNMRVGLFLPNTPYFLIAYYAVSKTGATLVHFNPLYPERELMHQIEDSGTEVMITLDLALVCDKAHAMLHATCLKRLILCRFADILPFPKNWLFPVVKRGEIGKVPHPARCLWFHDMVKGPATPAPIEINPADDVLLLQYTGGTTGVPKGAMLTHRNIYANAMQSRMWFPEAKQGQEKMLAVLPFFHVFAMTAVMNMGVAAAMEIIVPHPRFDLDTTLKAIHKKKPQYFPAVPAIYSAINTHPKRKKYDLSSLRYCISGGAPLPVEVKREFEAKTGCVVVEGYGLSESSPVVCINPTAPGSNRAGSIGLPVPGTVVEIVHLEDRRTPVTRGERGELCVRGPQVMKGYWNRPAETAEALAGGMLHTGDVAVMDAEGYVYIVDRIKDMIITNGYNVYPRNVEEAIHLHPAVAECIVAGLPDRQRGEIIKAWIRLKDGRTLGAEDLKEFLKDKLSPMEIPKQIEFRDEPLPKTMIGKLSRKDVVAQELEKPDPAAG